MNRKTKIFLAIAILALAALACNAVTGGGGGGGDTPDPTPAQKTILSDDFSSEKWGTGTDADSSIEYDNNTLHMIVYKKNWFVWSVPNAESYQNVHIEANAINNDTHETTAFGIICNKQSGANNFYYGAITPAGQYTIAKSSEGQGDVFLTNDNQWASSDVIAENASSYHLGMDCGNGTLTLYVDGQQIVSVSDASYSSGSVALFTWSGENSPKTDVAFDDFLMTELP